MCEKCDIIDIYEKNVTSHISISIPWTIWTGQWNGEFLGTGQWKYVKIVATFVKKLLQNLHMLHVISLYQFPGLAAEKMNFYGLPRCQVNIFVTCVGWHISISIPWTSPLNSAPPWSHPKQHVLQQLLPTGGGTALDWPCTPSRGNFGDVIYVIYVVN